jgi:carbon storage regulator CsrA
MLVLTRKIGQSVIVNGLEGTAKTLKITVLGTRQGKIKIGFEGDNMIEIVRSEVLEHDDEAEASLIAAPVQS